MKLTTKELKDKKVWLVTSRQCRQDVVDLEWILNFCKQSESVYGYVPDDWTLYFRGAPRSNFNPDVWLSEWKLCLGNPGRYVYWEYDDLETLLVDAWLVAKALNDGINPAEVERRCDIGMLDEIETESIQPAETKQTFY